MVYFPVRKRRFISGRTGARIRVVPGRDDADSALARVSAYLNELTTIPDDDAHREATALIARRDTLATAYTRLAAPPHSRDAGRPGPQHDTGLSL